MCNQYTFRPPILPIGPSIAYLALTKGQYALIDLDDILVGDNTWLAQWNPRKKNFYVARRAYPSRAYVYLHRELLNVGPLCVDHINGNTLDCRRINLRPATYSQNSMNTKLHSDNKSGYKGVTQNRHCGTWNAEIMIAGRRMRKSGFASAEEAAKWYVELARIYHGVFMSKTNNTPIAPVS